MSNSKNGSQPNGITNEPLPASHKIFVQSQRRPDVRVAMRAIGLSSGHNGHGNGAWRTEPCAAHGVRYLGALYRP